MTKSKTIKQKTLLKAMEYYEAAMQEQFKQVATLTTLVTDLHKRVSELEGRPVQNTTESGIIVPNE